MYISPDVVFDENVFPFAKLHPNAGAHLQSEIYLLPSQQLSSDHGGELLGEHLFNSHNSNAFTNDSGRENTTPDDTGDGMDDAIFTSSQTDPAPAAEQTHLHESPHVSADDEGHSEPTMSLSSPAPPATSPQVRMSKSKHARIKD